MSLILFFLQKVDEKKCTYYNITVLRYYYHNIFIYVLCIHRYIHINELSFIIFIIIS